MQQLPAAAGLDLANWNWKVVHRFVWERFGLSLCRSSCLTYLRRLGFAFKRPKKRLLKADEEKREAFVAAYALDATHDLALLLRHRRPRQLEQLEEALDFVVATSAIHPH